MRIETVDWKGWLQHAVSMIGMGYHYYQVVMYPADKRDKWPQIDKKMMEKFEVVDRFKRARRKQKGWANFSLARWNDQLLILRTEGINPPHLDLSGEKFKDATKEPLCLSFGKVLRLNISKMSGKVHVGMPRDLFDDWRANIEELAKTRSLAKMKWTLRRLNGIPAYAGINAQRRRLVEIAVEHLKANQVAASWKDFPFYRRRLTRQVFKID